MKKIICLLLCITSIVCFCACDKDSSSSKADKSDVKQEESNSSNKIKDSTKDDKKDIKPLQTLNIIAYASVSDDVYNICENTNLTLNILSDSEYIKEFYGKESPHETYSIEFDNK
mgnify:CR=1 FL=1